MKGYYFWYGGKQEPPYLIACKRSWEEAGLEVQRISFNVAAYKSIPYVKFCIENDNWAGLANFAQVLWFLDNDGVYLDSDMFLFKPIPEDFITGIYSVCFRDRVNPGDSIIYSGKRSPINIQLYKYYYRWTPDNNLKSHFDIFFDVKQNPVNVKSDDMFVHNSGIKIFGREYCYPIPLSGYTTNTDAQYFSDNTFGVHQWHGSCDKHISKQINKSCEKYQSIIQEYCIKYHKEYYTREE